MRHFVGTVPPAETAETRKLQSCSFRGTGVTRRHSSTLRPLLIRLQQACLVELQVAQSNNSIIFKLLPEYFVNWPNLTVVNLWIHVGAWNCAFRSYEYREMCNSTSNAVSYFRGGPSDVPTTQNFDAKGGLQKSLNHHSGVHLSHHWRNSLAFSRTCRFMRSPERARCYHEGLHADSGSVCGVLDARN